MLELTVVKTGFESFDAQHATGLAVLVAETFNVQVALWELGLHYYLVAPDVVETMQHSLDIGAILALPKNDDLAVASDLELANFDGLLAAALTSPGARLVSVNDARDKQITNPSVTKRGLDKVRRLVERLLKVLPSSEERSFLAAVLRSYSAEKSQVPFIRPRKSQETSVNMPINAAFAYSTRRPFRDGFVSDRSNIAIDGTPYANILALIGSARSLRAQRIGGPLVNIYVPFFRELRVRPGFWVPLLANVEYTPQQAAIVQLLSHYQACGSDFAALSCQTLHTQGAKQAFSLSSARLSAALFHAVYQAGLAGLLGRWHAFFTTPLEDSLLDQDLMCRAILTRNSAAWLEHLRDVSWVVNAHDENSGLAYSVLEVSTMVSSEGEAGSSLAYILEREQGTLRFGRSLRSLGEYKRTDLLDSLDQIDAARTRDQLLRALAGVAQKCVLAKAISNFVVVPNDTDLAYLLQDVEQWGVRDIASLLMVLSSLRYPPAINASAAAANVDFLSEYSI